jgi:dTMP kinase
MNLDCPDIMKPDLCIYLDLTPKQSLERITKGRDSVEIYENEETLSRVRAAFMRVFDDIGKRDNIKIINAYRTVSEVSEDICSVIDEICDTCN